jgi:hypothetical protein
MAMGIDQEIQRRMDAYRGNPQGLQQRYQMSQQLLDLLALQKLKAEKDAVARQMQSQMQQTPGTVAQQMEQEMLGRTKQEMAQQVGGVMQQQARQQQQNMARIAQAAARPQGGIAGLAPQGARPAPRMAGGGIVPTKSSERLISPKETINTIFSLLREGKFNDREAVIQAALELGKAESQEELTDLRRAIFMNYAVTSGNYPTQARILPKDLSDKLLNFELGDSAFKTFGMPYDDRKPQTAQPAPRMAGGGIVAFQGGGGTSREALQQRRDELRDLLSSRVYGGVDPALVQELKSVEDQLATITSGSFGGAYQQLRAIPAPKPQAAPAAVPAPNTAETKGGMAGVDDRELPPNLPPGPDSGTRDDGGMAGPRGPQSVISGVRDITAPAIPEKSSRTGEIESGIAALRTQGDSMGQLRGLTEFTDKYLRREDIRKAGEDRARRLAELDRAQMDPEALRRERLMAALIGAAGKSTFGLTGAGAAAGAENARQQQRIAERQRLVDQMALEQDVEKTDIELAKEGLAAGKVGYEQAALNRRAAEDIAMRLGADETQRIVQNARAELDALVANQQIDIEAAKDVAAQALQALKERGDDRRALEKELGDVQLKRTDFYKEAMRLALTNASLRGEVTAEEKKELEDQAILTANAWANEAGLLESEQRLEARIRELGGNVGVRRSRMISQ